VNDEFLPNSTRLSIKIARANRGFNLVQANPSQLAKQYPAASVRVAALAVLNDWLCISAKQVVQRWLGYL
jgi:hypothetical protein